MFSPDIGTLCGSLCGSVDFSIVGSHEFVPSHLQADDKDQCLTYMYWTKNDGSQKKSAI